MTADTAPDVTVAPATGLFGGGKADQAATVEKAPTAGEPSATQRKSFALLFRADGSELHAC